MALPVTIYLYPGNTQLVQLFGLQDVTTGLYLNAATVTATLYDQRGKADPVFRNIEMDYQSGTEGNYEGVVPAEFAPPAFTGQSPLTGFRVLVQADQAGVQLLYTIPAVITVRSSS